MKKLAAPLLLSLSLVLLSGCARYYVMKLSNGTRITSIGKPKLKGSHYEYKDASGRPQRISEGRVSEVEPASMAKREKSRFIPAPGQ
ncbi:MAG: YgdI/YgdR family lipoprotein [Limisphaerales bacterium]